MLSFFRPSFEVVKEGRILKKIKHLGLICFRFYQAISAVRLRPKIAHWVIF
jgi:hypothetical protein